MRKFVFLGLLGRMGRAWALVHARRGAGRARGRRGAQGSAHALRAQERRGRWGQRAMA